MSKQTTHHHHAKKHTPPKKHHKGKGKHGQGPHFGGGGTASPGGGHTGAPAKPPSTAHTKAKHTKHAKAHKLAIGDAVACCAAEALAATLRLAGQAVTGDQVLQLYWLTAEDEDAGAPIAVTLSAAAEHGLAGFRPSYQPVTLRASRFARSSEVQLILGAELPGPHAIAVDELGGWWSWGRRWHPSDFPAAVLEEAWAVTWS